MNTTHLWLLLLLVAAGCAPSEPLYSVRSKDHGAPFDLVLTEMKRNTSTSVISVPGFHARTAAGSRWLMCMYNDLAVKRGFKYWSVIYPEAPKETFPIAFYQSADDNVKGLLGSDYVAERAFPASAIPTEKWYQTICGWMK